MEMSYGLSIALCWLIRCFRQSKPCIRSCHIRADQTMTARLVTEKDLKPRVDNLVRAIQDAVSTPCEVQYVESSGGDIVAELAWPSTSGKHGSMKIVVYPEGYEVIPADAKSGQKFWCYHSEHQALQRASEAAKLYIK